MKRTLALFAVMAVGALPMGSAALASDDAAKHAIKRLEKILDRCQSGREKAKGAEKLAEAQAECGTALGEFFSGNSPIDVPEELKIKLTDLIVTGYVAVAPEQFGWNIKQNEPV